MTRGTHHCALMTIRIVLVTCSKKVNTEHNIKLGNMFSTSTALSCLTGLFSVLTTHQARYTAAVYEVHLLTHAGKI